MSTSPPLVSLIVPCYNEGPGLERFLSAVSDQAARMQHCRFEFLFVDDGSTDDSRGILQRAAEHDPRVKVLRLSRNFGHQRAITAGIDFAQGDYLIILDADLQDPPDRMPSIIGKLQDGWDVVHMVRSDRSVDSLAKRGSATLFYALMRRWVLPELPVNAGDFKGFSRRAAEALKQYPERVRFLRGMFASLGFRQTTLNYIREPRSQGRSKYRWRSILRLGRDAVMSNTVIPLRLALYLGAVLTFVISPFCFLRIFFTYASGRLESPMLHFFGGCQLLLSGVILMALGIMGEYLKVLMLEVKQRPCYLVEEMINITTDDV